MACPKIPKNHSTIQFLSVFKMYYIYKDNYENQNLRQNKQQIKFNLTNHPGMNSTSQPTNGIVYGNRNETCQGDTKRISHAGCTHPEFPIPSG